eukprot:5605933-Pyramimonas_sp.AAC.1
MARTSRQDHSPGTVANQHAEGPRGGPPTSQETQNGLASRGETIGTNTDDARQLVDLQPRDNPLADSLRELRDR